MTRSPVARPRSSRISHRLMGSTSFVVAVLLVTSALAAVTLSLAGQVSAATDPVIGAAGDIACDPANASFNGGAGTADACQQVATSNLLTSAGVTAVLPLGDTQYEAGTASQYAGAYNPSWGRLLSVTKPVVGNHEYGTTGASGYFTYFGARAGDPKKGYYSYDLGAWHLIALNSNCSFVSCAAGSAQETWLKQDLAANSGKCIAAYFHHPRFTTGGAVSDDTDVVPFWNDLYAAHADVVLNGHAHSYERFVPQTPSGTPDAFGITEITVGTGGEDHAGLGSPNPNTVVRDANTFGVLLMSLHATSYDFSFKPIAGGTFTDSGSGSCHAFATLPGAPTGVNATAGNASATVNWTPPANTGGAPLTSYTVTSSPGGITATAGGSANQAIVTGLTDGTTYTFTVKATNGKGTGPASSPSNAVTPVASSTTPLTNGGFETGTLTSWSKVGTAAAVTTPHSGAYSAQDGSTAATNGDSSIVQTFTLPSSATNLSFWYKVVCPDVVQYDWATATLKDNTTGTTTTLLPKTCSNTGAWSQLNTSVSAIAGHSVTLTLTSHDDNYAADPTRTLFDDVVVGTASTTTVPGAPTGVNAVAGNASANVSWTPPASNGGSAITGYTVTSSPAGGSVTVAGSASSATVAGLTNGTSYTFTVRATNGVGTGAASSPSNAVTPVAPPASGPVTNGGFETGSLSGWTPAGTTSVTSTAHTGAFAAQDGATGPTNGDSSVSQTFTVPAAGGMLSFWYRQTCPDVVKYDWATATVKDNVTGTSTIALPRTCMNTGAWVPVSSSLSAMAGHSVTVTLTSHDDNFAGDATSTVFDDVAVTAPTVPDAPTGVSATAGSASASVSWVAPVSDGGSPITSYRVTASPGGATVTASASARSAVVSGLTNGVSYTFTVSASNALGTGSASSASNAVVPSSGVAGVVNGGFESGSLSSWSAGGTTSVSTVAHTGSYAAVTGAVGGASNGDSTVAQTFTVPSTGGTLSLWYQVTCPDVVRYDWVTVTLRDNTAGTTTTVLAPTCTNTGAWVQVSTSLSAMAGHNATLTLLSHDDNYAGDGTYARFDDVTIT